MTEKMTEKEKLESDLRLYGVCYEKDGKRIDPRTVKISPVAPKVGIEPTT